MKLSIVFVVGAMLLCAGSGAAQDAAQTSKVFEAARAGDLARLEALIGSSPGLVNARDEEGSTPLHAAAESGRMNIALFLLGRGAEPDARNSLKQSPLLYAAYGGYTELVDTLIARGATSDQPDTFGNAPIHYAARQGQTAVVELLLAKGASFDGRGRGGRTPLHFAAANGRAEIVKLLAARGAKLDTRDDTGKTPMTSALEGGHAGTAEALLDAGVPIERDAAALAGLLHLAARAGSQRIVDVLIEKGANLDDKDEAGRTLLHDAAIGNLPVLAAMLITRTRDMDQGDKSGKTALHYAVIADHREVVDLLLSRSADPNVCDSEGRTPLHMAEDAGRGDLAKLLRAHGARDVERRVYSLGRAPAGAARSGKGEPLEITYIGNEGFLIARGDKKVLIDAPQSNPWTYTPTGERILSLMLEDRPPFDGLDLVVASHAHADHISPKMAAELVKRNPRVVFISNAEACDSMRIVSGSDFGKISTRVVSVDPEWKTVTKLSRNGVNVEFFGVNHTYVGQPPRKTLATIVDLGGIRVAHLADEIAASNVENYKAIDLAKEGIDIVFLDQGFFDSNGEDILKNYIKPEYLILMHARPDEVDEAGKKLLPSHPNLILFHEQMEKKLFR